MGQLVSLNSRSSWISIFQILQNINEKIIITIEWTQDDENINIKFKKDASSNKLILHWGIIYQFPPGNWYHPRISNLPVKTKKFDNYALDTEFVKDENGEKIELNFYKKEGIGLSFVFYEPFYNIWYNNNRKDFQILFNKPGQNQIENKMTRC